MGKNVSNLMEIVIRKDYGSYDSARLMKAEMTTIGV